MARPSSTTATGAAVATLAVLVEPKAAILARLQRALDEIQRRRTGILTGILTGIKRARAQGDTRSIENKNTALAQGNAHIADIKTQIRLGQSG